MTELVPHWVSEKFRRRIKRLPPLRYLVPAIVLIVIAYLVQQLVDPVAVKAFCDSMVHDLQAIEPLSFVWRYYETWMSLGSHDTPWPIMLFLYPFVAWYLTAVALWNSTGLAGHILIPLAILGALWPANRLSAWMFEDSPVRLVGAVVLTPIVAGLLAMVVQYLLIGLFGTVGYVIGLALFLGGALGGLGVVINRVLEVAHKVEDAAGSIESAAGLAAVVSAPSAPQPAALVTPAATSPGS